MYIRQSVPSNREIERFIHPMAYHLATYALHGRGGYQICFEPGDILELVQAGIVPQEEIDWANKLGTIELITVNPLDHGNRVTLQAVTFNHEGMKSLVPLRNDDPRYGHPLREFQFLEFIRTHQ